MQIRDNVLSSIRQRCGFIPAWMEPALDTQPLLADLWQQMQVAYLDNPIPILYKEYLCIYLARYSTSPYFLVYHSCNLFALGLRGVDIWELLNASLPSEHDIAASVELLRTHTQPLAGWPAPNTPLAQAMLDVMRMLGVRPHRVAYGREVLQNLIGSQQYNYLAALLGYIKTCQSWGDTHSSISYTDDQLVQTQLTDLLAAEPRLELFFRTHYAVVWSNGHDQSALLPTNALLSMPAPSSDHHSRFANDVGDVVYQTNRQGKWIYLDPSWTDLTGWSIEASIEKSPLDYVHPDDRITVNNSVAQLVSGGIDYQRHEIRLRTHDGAIRWVIAHYRAIRDIHGAFAGLAGVLRDTTFRHTAEDALQRRGAILEAVRLAAERLLRVPRWTDAIEQILAQIGVAAHASRVTVFERTTSSAATTRLHRRYEWAKPGITSQLADSSIRHFYEDEFAFPRWADVFMSNSFIYGDIQSFPVDERAVLLAEDIRVVIGVPIFVGTEWWGVLRLDECVYEQDWSTPERDALQTAASLLGSAIQRDTAASALHASEERYRLVVEHSPNAIVVYKDAKLVYVNQAAAQVIQAESPQDLVGRSVFDFVTPTTLGSVQARVSTIAKERAALAPAEEQFRRLDGVVIDVEVSAVPISWDGAPAVQLIIRDITQHKIVAQHQQLLATVSDTLATSLDYQTTMERLAQLMVPELADVCIINAYNDAGSIEPMAWACADPAKQRFVDEIITTTRINPNSPYAYPKVIQTAQAELYPHLDDAWLQAIALNERHLELLRLVDIRSAITVPLTVQGRTFGTISLRLVGQAHKYNTEDLERAQEIARRAALAVDNARLYRDAQQALGDRAESLALFDAFFANAPLGLAFLDRDSRYVRINESLAVLNQLSIADHLGRTVGELMPSAGGFVQSLLEQVVATGAALTNQELTLVHSDGEYTCLANFFPVRTPDNQIRRIGLAVTDISDRKRAEEARIAIERKMLDTQKLESLGVLAGGIAHDFNNLLAVITGNVGLALLDAEPNTPIVESLQQIDQAAQHAADLTRQMLAYSGRGQFSVQQFNVNQVVKEMTLLLRASIAKSTMLIENLAPALPNIVGDVTQIRQIILNLIINASEALADDHGSVTITTATRHVSQAFLAQTHLAPDLPDGEYVALEIADTGAGMDEETRNKIFDPFFTTKFTGRGLGLAAVLGIVRGHKGALSVDSKPNQGTIFTILLPLAPTAKTTSAAQPDHTPVPLERPARATVLVVDDEEHVRIVTKRILQRLGFDVLTASDGISGLQLIQAQGDRLDGVLLDLTMPRMNGETALHEIRRTCPSLPVVLMSGYTEEDTVHRFKDDGLVGFLHKPFRLPDVQEVLHHFRTHS